MTRTQLSSVFIPSAEESTDDDDPDSEESEFLNIIKATMFQLVNEVEKAMQKSPRKMTIKTSQHNPEGKSIWNKKQYCVLRPPKGSKKRRILLEQLRNQGNKSVENLMWRDCYLGTTN